MNRNITLKFDSLWKLMSEHTFILDPDSIHDDLACMICKKLMVDAWQTPCGCQYCYKCISDYLANGDTYCPGGKSECKLEYLVLERDLLRDPKSNNKILKSKVLCPNTLCQSKIELSKMEEHMEMCMKQSTIGLPSGHSKLDKDRILDYLHNEIYTHTESIMNNFKNEFDGFKERLGKYGVEIESLKEALRNREVQIGEMENIKIELRNKDYKIMTLEKKLEDMQRERMTDKNMAIANVSRIKHDLSEQINFHGDDIKDMHNTLTYKINTLERRMIYYSKWKKLCPNIDVDCAWKIDHLSMNNGQDCFSEPFYCYGYQFRLCVNLNGGKIALFCHIMKGSNDNDVDWPMLAQVTLSIVNQETMKPHRMARYQYDTYFSKYRWVFERPRYDMNRSGIGAYAFIRYSEIMDEPSIVADDSLVVSCEINHNVIIDHLSTDAIDDLDGDTHSLSDQSFYDQPF